MNVVYVEPAAPIPIEPVNAWYAESKSWEPNSLLENKSLTACMPSSFSDSPTISSIAVCPASVIVSLPTVLPAPIPASNISWGMVFFKFSLPTTPNKFFKNLGPNPSFSNWP